MRIVIDTNVVASAIFFGGRPRDLLEELFNKRIDAVVSPEILAEYKETFEELCARYPQKTVRVPLTEIAAACQIVLPKQHFEICRDPDDDKFIDCAVEADCIYIVSGDKDLLVLKQFQDVEIVTVAEFFDRYMDENDE